MKYTSTSNTSQRPDVCCKDYIRFASCNAEEDPILEAQRAYILLITAKRDIEAKRRKKDGGMLTHTERQSQVRPRPNNRDDLLCQTNMGHL